MERLIETEAERKRLVAHIGRLKLPFRITTKDGRSRSLDQNRLQFQWAGEIAEQRGDTTAQEQQQEWKLTRGVPILAAENAEFATAWLSVEVNLSYEERLRLMSVIPVTSLMTMKQLSQYLDEIYREYTEAGYELTRPEA